jgi:hypothetical protein
MLPHIAPFLSLPGAGRAAADNTPNEDAETNADASNDVLVKCRRFMF